MDHTSLDTLQSKEDSTLARVAALSMFKANIVIIIIIKEKEHERNAKDAACWRTKAPTPFVRFQRLKRMMIVTHMSRAQKLAACSSPFTVQLECASLSRSRRKAAREERMLRDRYRRDGNKIATTTEDGHEKEINDADFTERLAAQKQIRKKRAEKVLSLLREELENHPSLARIFRGVGDGSGFWRSQKCSLVMESWESLSMTRNAMLSFCSLMMMEAAP